MDNKTKRKMSAFDGLGTEDVAPSALDFQMPTKTSFVQSRSTVRYTPTSGSTYSNENRILTFRISSEQYLDPTTATLNFVVKSPSPNAVFEDTAALKCIQDIRVTVGGTQLEMQNQVGNALQPILFHSASADYLSSSASVCLGAYGFKPSVGLSLNSSDSGGVIFQADNTSDPIGGLSGTSALGNVANAPNTFVGTTYRANSFPSGLERRLSDAGGSFSSRKVLGLDFNGRAFSISLSLLSGLWRGNRYLPARNMGAIEITITFAPYSAWFIQTAPITVSSTNVLTVAENNDAPYNAYTISQCSITVDALQIAPEVVSKVDSACSSDSGVNMVIDTFVTSLFSSRPPSTMDSFVCTRPYSNLLATYLCCRPTAGANSPYWNKSQYYGGSRFAGLQTTVGSLTFPVSEIQNTAQAWGELRKALARNNVSLEKGNAITYEAYNSLYAGTYGCYTAACRGTAPDIKEITGSAATNGTRSTFASSLSNASPSQFLLGQSFSRVLGDSATVQLTGLNSKLSGYSMTTNLRQLPVYASPNTTDPVAGPPCTLDSALQSEPMDWLVTQVCSVLMRLANDSVAVAD